MCVQSPTPTHPQTHTPLQLGEYDNVAVVHTNAMKYLPNYIHKAQVRWQTFVLFDPLLTSFSSQLTKLFFLFPDPHFKKANKRRRIIRHLFVCQCFCSTYTLCSFLFSLCIQSYSPPQRPTPR